MLADTTISKFKYIQTKIEVLLVMKMESFKEGQLLQISSQGIEGFLQMI